MAKSLKTFVRESAIKKEVATWTIKDCDDYLNKHKYDNVKPNSLMAKKLNIVKEHQEILKNIESAKKRKATKEQIY